MLEKLERKHNFAFMKFEERKLISIPRAIGLFMIFEGLFRRGSLEGITFSDSTYHTFLRLSANSSIYLLLISGFLLCITHNLLLFYLTYLTCAISLFGIVFEILPGSEVNLIWCISMGIAHLAVVMVMIWTQIQIKKTLIKQNC